MELATLVSDGIDIFIDRHVYLGKEYLESQNFYPKHGYVEYKEWYMKKICKELKNDST